MQSGGNAQVWKLLKTFSRSKVKVIAKPKCTFAAEAYISTVWRHYRFSALVQGLILTVVNCYIPGKVLNVLICITLLRWKL